MFDLRYHVASLAAVFIALVIGILVGVGIADRGVREDALAREDRARSTAQLDQARGQTDFLERQQEATQNFVEDSYPALMSTPPRRQAGRARLRRLGRRRPPLERREGARRRRRAASRSCAR